MMRIRSASAALMLVSFLLLLGPRTARAVDWEEWKFLIRKRPVAVLVAIPPLLFTSPFMATKWLLSSHGGDDDDMDADDEDYDEDEDE